MDISFACKCGQNIVIDEAGAGITVDCPQCGRPAYVPSSESAKAKDIPIRVETPLAKLMAKQGQTPAPQAPRPSTPFFTPHKREDIHPAIRASLTCLVIVAGLGLLSLVAVQHNLELAVGLLYMAYPFIGAAPLCATYGMCVGHVKHGLFLLAAMSLMIGLSAWIVDSMSNAMLRGYQQQIEKQFQELQKQLPKFPR